MKSHTLTYGFLPLPHNLRIRWNQPKLTLALHRRNSLNSTKSHNSVVYQSQSQFSLKLCTSTGGFVVHILIFQIFLKFFAPQHTQLLRFILIKKLKKNSKYALRIEFLCEFSKNDKILTKNMFFLVSALGWVLDSKSWFLAFFALGWEFFVLIFIEITYSYLWFLASSSES